ncbi:MAG TPA: GntR family transcriptional regulator [Bryobacteraceae bacterium]|jgi:GntR family transcriptional regulator
MFSTAQNGKPAFLFRLDTHSGIPAYRQIIDQVTAGMATGSLKPGDQLPTVRQLAVDLAINPNTVVRAYRELEIRGVLETQQGTGTFIGNQQTAPDDAGRERRLDQLASEFVARAGAGGFTLAELIERLREMQPQDSKKKKGR